MFVYKYIRKILNLFFKALVMFRVGARGRGLHVGGLTILNSSVIIGDNTNFNGMRVCGRGRVVIGDNFHSGRECMMITENHDHRGEKIPYDSNIIYKEVIIGDNVWLGNRVLILGGVDIGEGAIIQAGSVVTSNIPPLAIAGGSPAKPFKYRDELHYFSAKNEKRFH